MLLGSISSTAKPLCTDYNIRDENILRLIYLGKNDSLKEESKNKQRIIVVVIDKLLRVSELLNN